MDSLLIPTTQKFQINNAGFFYTLKYPQTNPPKKWGGHLNPLVLLDYRCHVGKDRDSIGECAGDNGSVGGAVCGGGGGRGEGGSIGMGLCAWRGGT